jgi:hypothetical protein
MVGNNINYTASYVANSFTTSVTSTRFMHAMQINNPHKCVRPVQDQQTLDWTILCMLVGIHTSTCWPSADRDRALLAKTAVAVHCTLAMSRCMAAVRNSDTSWLSLCRYTLPPPASPNITKTYVQLGQQCMMLSNEALILLSHVVCTANPLFAKIKACS